MSSNACQSESILTLAEVPGAVAFRATGVAELAGRVTLLLTVRMSSGAVELRVARSRDGVSGWIVELSPLISTSAAASSGEMLADEPARISFLPELAVHVITYCRATASNWAVCAAATRDFTSVCSMGTLEIEPSSTSLATVVTQAVFVPNRVDGGWRVMIERAERAGSCGAGRRVWSMVTSDNLWRWGGEIAMSMDEACPACFCDGATLVRQGQSWVYYNTNDSQVSLKRMAGAS